MNPYRVLGIKDTKCSQDSILKHFRKLAFRFHPDRNPGDDKADARYKEVVAAYELLSDVERRRRYDETGDTSTPRVPTNSDQEILSVLVPTFLEQIRQASNCGEIDRRNLLDSVRSIIRMAISSARQHIDKLTRDQKTLKSLLGRFKTKSGDTPNLFEEILRRQILDVDKPLKHAESEIAKFERILTFLAEFTYDTPPASGGGMSTSASVSIGSIKALLGGFSS